jgi:membrane protein involved in colicin uptake
MTTPVPAELLDKATPPHLTDADFYEEISIEGQVPENITEQAKKEVAMEAAQRARELQLAKEEDTRVAEEEAERIRKQMVESGLLPEKATEEDDLSELF